jgi:uncharacterized protein involved in exopolysaccharide biosynthesis
LRADPPRAVRMGRSPAREAAETDLERTEADKGQARAGESLVGSHLARIDKRLAQLAENEQTWQALERDRRLAEADYEAAAKRLRDERIMANMDRQRQSSVSVVQSPRVPLEGKSPRLVILVVGMVLTLAAALLTAFLSALFRQMAQPVSRPSGFSSSQPPL